MDNLAEKVDECQHVLFVYNWERKKSRVSAIPGYRALLVACPVTVCNRR